MLVMVMASTVQPDRKLTVATPMPDTASRTGLIITPPAHAAYAARGRRREAYQEIQYSLQQKHHLIGAKCAVVSYILVRAAGFVKRAGQNRHGLPF